LIRFGQDRAYVRVVVSGARSQVIEVAFDRATGERRFKVNNVTATRGELIGRLAVVMAGPLDDEVIRGAPVFRRRLLDAALSQVSPSYFFVLTRYTRVIRQRNQLLRSDASRTVLAPWDEQLVELGAALIERRRRFVELLGARAAERHACLGGGEEKLQVAYLCAVGEGDERRALARALELRREEELRRGSCVVGPHRDDLRFAINGVDLRTFGSRGQHHAVALSLRLAEVDLLKAELGEWPVVLLDDVLAHLDGSRQALLLRELAGPQVLLTHTDVPPVSGVSLRVLRVTGGIISEGAGVSRQGPAG
jgi:DNA replication and repair protein RecF